MAKRHRPYWKGFIRLSLVTIGVEIFNAVESKGQFSFRQIHKPTGRRVNYEKTVPGVGKVENTDIVKGYEVDADTYVVLEHEEIEAAKLESKKTIDLVQFVDVKEVDYRYFERPYFVAPADPLSGEGYVVIRDALAASEKMGLAQVTIGGREWLVAIAAMGKGLVMEMLRYAEELREPADYFAEVPDEKPQKEMVSLAAQLIEQKSAPFKPEGFRDRYQEALRTLVEQKMRGKTIVAQEDNSRPVGANVIDLMDALKRSIGEPSSTPEKSVRKSARPAKRARPFAKKQKVAMK